MSCKNCSIYAYTSKKKKKTLTYMNAVKQRKLHILSLQKNVFRNCIPSSVYVCV